jgi:hypothetical protein
VPSCTQPFGPRACNKPLDLVTIHHIRYVDVEYIFNIHIGIFIEEMKIDVYGVSR